MLTERDGTRYENDDNKRRTKKVVTRPDGVQEITTYCWDVRDRLREVGLPDGRRAFYAYDAFARRTNKRLATPAEGTLAEQVARALNGDKQSALPTWVTTDYLWDGDVLCAELRDEGPRVHVHEPGGFAPLLQVEQGQVFTVVNDHLGMPKDLVDTQGRVAWSAAHSAWGRLLEVQRDDGAAEVESPFRLLGQYADD